MNRQNGFVNLKAAFFLLVACAIAFAGIKVVPVYIGNYQLQDRMQTEARFALGNHHSPEEIRKTIYREALDQELPLRPDDIRVSQTAKGTFISASYTVPVDLRFYRFELHFNPSSDSF